MRLRLVRAHACPCVALHWISFARSCLGFMIFQSCIDQGCPHAMGCQIEPLIIQDKIQDITLLISRAFPFNEQNHVVPDADKLLDCCTRDVQ